VIFIVLQIVRKRWW